MTAVSITNTSGAGVVDRRATVEARLAAGFEPWRRRLVSIARYRYHLTVEDCEEIAADTLLTWYQHLDHDEGVHADGAYLFTVLHNRALDHKKAQARLKRAAATVPLTGAECVGADPHLDGLVGEREELHDLAELAHDVLSPIEREIVLLSRLGVPRAELARRHGLSVRCVERYLKRAQRRLDEAVATMSVRGRCAMLALTVSDIKTGRIGPGHPRYERGIRHLRRCPQCRTTKPITVGVSVEQAA
jgi:DNA-directed RNA polymerase specialized sigma24 family protein